MFKNKKNKKLRASDIPNLSLVAYEAMHPSPTDIFIYKLIIWAWVGVIALYVQYMLYNMW